jgi:hypothetical protein
MNKSEVKITMKTTHKDKVLEEVIEENPHRKSKAIILFNKRCLDHGHVTSEQLITMLKARDSLVFFKYAFERDD